MNLFPTSLNVKEAADNSTGLCISLLAFSSPHTQGKTLYLREAYIKSITSPGLGHLKDLAP